MSMTISVRYEPKQDLDFIASVLGRTISETVRSLIDNGRKMKSPAIVPAWVGQSRTGRESIETHVIEVS